jgi:pSer/pThr/pTyr-binding forkhead associated (FHA) protein
MSMKRLDTGAIYELSGGALRIGRDPSCDIVIDDRDVSRQHAKVESDGARITLADLQSTNGTMLNNWRINRPEILRAGDVFVIADVSFEIQDQHQTRGEDTSFREGNDATNFRSAKPENRSFRDQNSSYSKPIAATADEPSDATAFKNPMKTVSADLSAIPGLNSAEAVLVRQMGRGRITLLVMEQNASNKWSIGRLRDCDVMIDDQAVSREHCLIMKRGDRWQIDDQTSRNGTYVNDLEIKMTYLSSGDRITLGNYEVVFLPLV